MWGILNLSFYSNNDDEGFSGKTIETNANLFKSNFSNIDSNKFAFLTEDINDCNIIKNILGISITCKTDKSEIINN